VLQRFDDRRIKPVLAKGCFDSFRKVSKRFILLVVITFVLNLKQHVFIILCNYSRRSLITDLNC